jgi:hypothetical protein
MHRAIGAMGAAIVLTIGSLLPASAFGCRLALALGMDVSASVNTQEYRLQMAGTAAALTSAPVRAELFRADPIALALFLWSGARERWLISDWVLITDAVELERFANLLATAKRPRFNGRTATGEAMRAGAELLARAPDCVRQVVDLATDGRANAGIAPASVAVQGVVINALSVDGGTGPLDLGDGVGKLEALSAYLRRYVIRGPGAFVERAKNYADFERAFQRKLLREMQDVMLGAVAPLPN